MDLEPDITYDLSDAIIVSIEEMLNPDMVQHFEYSGLGARRQGRQLLAVIEIKRIFHGNVIVWLVLNNNANGQYILRKAKYFKNSQEDVVLSLKNCSAAIINVNNIPLTVLTNEYRFIEIQQLGKVNSLGNPHSSGNLHTASSYTLPTTERNLPKNERESRTINESNALNEEKIGDCTLSNNVIYTIKGYIWKIFVPTFPHDLTIDSCPSTFTSDKIIHETHPDNRDLGQNNASFSSFQVEYFDNELINLKQLL